MALVPALLLILLVESLAAVGLAATAGRIRLVADRRLAIEAGYALEHAMASARIGADSLLASWPAATVGAIPVTPIPGWEVAAQAERDGAAPVVRLRVRVGRRDGAGVLVAAREGTLLLAITGADTAIVLDNRPRN